MTPLPPGPADGPLRQTVRLHRDPLASLREAQVRFGDVFTVRLTTARPLVVVTAVDEVQPLLEADPDAAHAGEARRRILPLASAHSVFGGDAQVHADARGRVAAAFTPDAVAGHRDAIEAITRRHAERWPRGRPFRLLPRLRAVIDEVFVRRFLGVADDRRAEAMTAAIGRMLWTPGNPPVSVPGAGNGLLGAAGAALFERRQAPLKTLLTDEIAARRDGGDDVLSLAARSGQPPPDVADELLPLLMAAQEPPASGMTWLLERLLREDGLAERFRDDASARDPIVRETLRLRPPALAALRRLTAPRSVAGHELPKGITVALPIPLLQRDPVAFPDPDRFDPDRWATPVDERPYLPFGGGVRRCIGEHLAHAYIDVMVPAILRAVQLRPVLPGYERMVLRGTILVPQRSGLGRVASERVAGSF